MDYRTITYKNRTFTLLEQATLTNRVFDYWYGDAQYGEAYISEWAALAEDEHGISCRVYFHFDAIKGQEWEDDSNWAWDEEHVYRVDVLG